MINLAASECLQYDPFDNIHKAISSFNYNSLFKTNELCLNIFFMYFFNSFKNSCWLSWIDSTVSYRFHTSLIAQMLLHLMQEPIWFDLKSLYQKRTRVVPFYRTLKTRGVRFWTGLFWIWTRLITIYLTKIWKWNKRKNWGLRWRKQ